jgi:heat shock protein HslJ
MNARLCRLTLLIFVFILGILACEESRMDTPAPSDRTTPDSSTAPDSSAAPDAPDASPAPDSTAEPAQRLQAVGTSDDWSAPTDWLLESYGGADNPQKVVEGVKVTATFVPGANGGGVVRGNAGCNGYSASFEREGSNLKIGQAIATRKFCGAPGVMEQEAAFLTALPAASTFEVEKDRLTITCSSGQEMHFTKQRMVEAKD